MGTLLRPTFPKINPVADTAPVSGVTITSPTAPDLRQFLHGLAMVWVPVLAMLGYGTEEQAWYWAGLVFGVIDSLLLSFPNTADKARAVTFAVGGLAQAALGAFGILTETNAAILVGAAISSVVSFISFRYTPSSVIQPTAAVAAELNTKAA